MKISTRVELHWDGQDYIKIADEHYFYEGEVALAGGGGQPTPPSTTTTTQKTEPWSAQQPYLTTGFQKAQDLFLNSTPSLYPTSTIAPKSAETQAALNLTLNRALNGSPLQDASKNQLTNTLNGAYLDNPTIQGNYLYGGDGFNAAVIAATNRALPQVASQFEAAGRTHSGLADVAKAQVIGDAFASQYGQERALQEQNFQTERENQMRAMLFAPQMVAQDYNDIAQLAAVGSANDTDAQNALNEKVYRYTYDQNASRENLLDYMRLVTGNFGSSGTSTGTTAGLQQMSGNPITAGLGGALSGASLFGKGGALAGAGIGGPWGAAVGGGLGILSAMFG